MAVIENTDGSDLGMDMGSTHQGPVALAAERSNGVIDDKKGMTREEEVKREVKQLQELLSKLNPMAEEFVPPSLVANGVAVAGGGFYPNVLVMQNGFLNGGMGRIGGRRVEVFCDLLDFLWLWIQFRVKVLIFEIGFGVLFQRRNGFVQGKRRINSRTSAAQREEVIRRTVYVSEIDQQVTAA